MVLLMRHPSHQSYPFSPQQPASIASDEESDIVLDDRILEDPLTADMASYDQQSESYGGNQGFMSAGHSTWQNIPSGNEPMSFPSMNHQNQFFPSNPTNHYQHPEQASEYAGHDAHWQHQTPLASAPHSTPFGNYSSEPAIKPEEPYQHQIEAVPPHALPTSTSAESQQKPPLETSPRSDNGWMSTSSSDHMERPLKRDHVHFFFDNPPRLRPDGVRKKNARFEIPEDRNVDTIDRIIEQADQNDEGLIKELKQQKRLLRNRQAALDSRCRKKEHTQKLEDERKILVNNLEAFQEEIHQCRQQEGMWLQERASWQATVDRLMMEKEELVRQHTLETAELRKKNNMLMEDVQRRPSISMSTVPSSAGYSSTFSEFDHLSMNDSPTWDDFSLLHQGHAEPEVPKPKPISIAQPKDDGATKEDDNPAASGLLLMLLLCGAWVASKGSTSAAGMPQMPEDVRAASTTVLDNIYKDVGLAPQSNNNDMAVMKAPQSHQHAMNPAYSQPNNPFAAFNHLTAPTLQQQRDEVFSLTPTQYNAITTDDSLYSTTQSSPPRGRRNLQGALSSIRLNKKGTASEAYTKSLMWDEVPTDVVRDFARMLNERNTEPMS